jgi:hypothetical protein
MRAFCRNYSWVLTGLLLVTAPSSACGPLGFASGDEAPIRVKGGSIDLELLNTTQTWRKTGSDNTKWKISGGRRDHEDYALTVDAKQGTCNVTADRKTTVRVTYSDNHYVEFSAQGNHTAVQADVPLSTSPDERTLSYAISTGYISAIQLDGRLACSFASRAEFTKLDAND